MYGAGTVAFSCLWGLLARDTPADAGKAASTTQPIQQQQEQQRGSWRIFAAPPIWAVVLMHTACNNVWTVMDKVVFTYFDEVLGCSALMTGN